MSKTRETNVHGLAYGPTWTESTATPAAPTLKSLTPTRISPAIATACEATGAPSTKKSTLAAFQSIR